MQETKEQRRDVRRGAMEKARISGSLREKRLEEMTQSNTFSPRRPEVSFEYQWREGN